jgi:hypothetical protein
MENIMGILHIINKDKMMNTLESSHIYIETKTDNETNDKCRVRPYMMFVTLILKYTNRGQSPLKFPLPTVTSLSHKLQHSQHARVRSASHLHNKMVINRKRSHTSYLYCNFFYWKFEIDLLNIWNRLLIISNRFNIR